MLIVRDSSLAFALDGSHLFGMVVIVRECSIDIGDINTVAICDRSRFKTTILNLRFDELHRDAPTFEMRFIM